MKIFTIVASYFNQNVSLASVEAITHVEGVDNLDDQLELLLLDFIDEDVLAERGITLSELVAQAKTNLRQEWQNFRVDSVVFKVMYRHIVPPQETK